MHRLVEINIKKFFKKINNAEYALILRKLMCIYQKKVI